MNIQQKIYAMAKVHLATLEERQHEIEKWYIAEHGIVNPDGEIPSWVYAIEDMDIFEQANVDVSTIVNDIGLWDEILDAKRILKDAEDALLVFGLSVLPPDIREKTEKIISVNYTQRQKFIDVAFFLDEKSLLES